jgi:hypothetical protein
MPAGPLMLAAWLPEYSDVKDRVGKAEPARQDFSKKRKDAFTRL